MSVVVQYTLSNYKFAMSLEPHNQALVDAQAWATQRRQVRTPSSSLPPPPLVIVCRVVLLWWCVLSQEGLPTVPSTLGKEWATNPFMRANQESIRVR